MLQTYINKEGKRIRGLFLPRDSLWQFTRRAKSIKLVFKLSVFVLLRPRDKMVGLLYGLL
ncbi:hypothetical protein Aasi_1863 [Candidatus Amoebophilus asiaticus 5a2]|uniref:Uncharacterized protein n=1 Tax=Amoebophilus asiaticus (strain 5a2) TaxID=452471 RepID=C3L460_AMOA5|nr:hypothetical protein Aasi_1863 [Candidatus Amoebophilus asiaticus 5a2]